MLENIHSFQMTYNFRTQMFAPLRHNLKELVCNIDIDILTIYYTIKTYTVIKLFCRTLERK